jgi:hypothetical protein
VKLGENHESFVPWGRKGFFLLFEMKILPDAAMFREPCCIHRTCL